MPLVKSLTLAITASAKRLSDAYGDGAGIVNAVNDVPYRQLLISTETDAFLGDSTVTTAAYGYKILAAATQPLAIGPFFTGPIKLSEVWVVGTSGNLHILGIPY